MSAADPVGWRRPDPPLPVVSFVDLDDTLFRSPARGGRGRAVTVTRDGRPYSYMSPQQQQLFALLRRAGRVIPTTARVPAQLRRVRLPFDDCAICANGAVILDPDGARVSPWAERVAARVGALSAGPEAVLRLARGAPGGSDLRIEAVAVDGRPLMIDARHPERRIPPVRAWARALRPRLPGDWLLDRARDRALLHPRGVDKRSAVRWFVEHRVEQPALILGAGDRQGDHGFMAACDFAMMPTGSVLFEAAAPSEP